jgi:hypothetical protein
MELKDFDLPFDKYNITSNNNILNFKIYTNNQTVNISDEYYNLNIDSDNIIELRITMGLYTIDKLCEVINQALANYNIEILCSTTTNLITFKSTTDTNFDIILNTKTLFYNLGFVQDIVNINKIVGIKIYDLKVEHYLNIYIENINDSKPVMQLSSNLRSKNIIFNKPIANLNQIKIRITDTKDKEYTFGNLDFSFELIIRSINHIQPTIIENESSIISSDDMFTIIKQNIS